MATNKRLSATITIGGAISGTLSAAFGKVNGKLGEIGKTVTNLTKRQKLLGKAIQDFGRAGKNVDGLRRSYAKLTEQIDRARYAQQRLIKAQSFKANAGKVGGYLKSGAMYAGIGAASIGMLARPTIGAAIERENAENVVKNTGETKENTAAMIKAAEGAKQFGVSTTEAIKVVGELRQALGTSQHAIGALPLALKAMSGLQLYNREHAGSEIGDDAIRALAKIADERGATDEDSQKKQFDWAFKAITSSSNTVGASDLLVAQRGAKAAGLAMDDKAFFGDTFLMQALSAPSYGKAVSTLNNALIGGHQDAHKFTNMLDDGLLDPKKVQLKNGLVTNYQQDALFGHDLLIKDQQAWVEKYLIPLANKKGINIDDAAQVQGFAARYFSNTNAANVMFMRMHNRVGINRDRENVWKGHGTEESDVANRNSTAGKEENVRARLNDAETRVGTVLLPAFASAMEKTANVLERVNQFAQDNPRLFKGIVEGLGGLAIGLAVVVPVLLGANAILQTIAFVKLARATAEVTSMLGAMNGVQGAAASASGGIVAFLGKLGLVAGLATVALALAKAAGLPDVDKNSGIDDVKNGKWWAASAHLPAATFLHALGSRAMGNSDADVAVAIGGTPTEKSPPAIPAPAGSLTQSAPQVNVGGITIYQQPFQSTKDLATEVINQMNKKTAVQSRSIMFDGASQ